MNRQVELVLLCEDSQHEAFLRRFFEAMGWPKRRFRVEKARSGRGAGEQYVRERFPIELASYRQRRGMVGLALAVMLDGDATGVTSRIAELDAACRAAGVEPRKGNDRVAVFLPTWNIETWIAYLSGDTVQEDKSNYRRLRRERECQPHVNTLVKMCHANRLKDPAPASLQAACIEYLRLAPT